MSPLGAAGLAPVLRRGGGGGGVVVPVQPGEIADAGVINPHAVTSDMPFVQAVLVPTSVAVPQGVYGVRVGERQLAAQARTVKHRPDGNARILRVEGVWPGDLTTAQTITLTELPPAITPEVTVELASGTLRLLRGGSLAHTITPYAATASLSGSKPSNLKGSNSSTAYIHSESFHEWHVTRPGSQTSVGAAFEDLTVEEDTAVLRCYLATGRGASNGDYQFQMRLIVYKAKPWVRWEFTSFKHMPVNTPAQSGANPALSAERLTITPASPFTSASIKAAFGSSLSVQATPYGVVSGAQSGDVVAGEDPQLNAVRLAGPEPLSAAVVDLMAMGPSRLVATTGSLAIDLWSEHTNEVLDFRGTGTSGEVQAESADYNASPRGTARTWLGFFALAHDLPLAQKVAARDDLWFPTPAALEASQAFGPLRAAAGSAYAAWWRRVNAFARIGEGAALRHRHVGYGQLGLTPVVVPHNVDTNIDRYAADEPMHSGRYGQTKDSYTGTGALISALLTSDRTRALRALRAALAHCDLNGVHGVLYGSNYAGSAVDGVHRRYRDPWTGVANDTQYYYPESQFTAYWVGGARRHLERAMKICAALDSRSAMPYPHRVWASAVRYQHTHAGGDLTKLNDHIEDDVAESNADFPPPGALSGTVASFLWDNFRYGHNTCPAVIEVYEATGNADHLDELAAAYGTHLNWASNNVDISAYGQYTTPFHALAYLLLRGYDAGDVSQNAINSMQFWIGSYVQAGTMRNHATSLPSGDPDTWTWPQTTPLISQVSEEGAGFQRRFGPMIASYLA